MNRVSRASLTTATSIVAIFAATSAFADQNVANTSQKGSLLVWPLITVDQTKGASGDTLVELSNDANARVHVECEYVNERKGRVNFDFELSGKGTASWDVLTQNGDHVTPPPFPTNTGNPKFHGNPYRGELVCFATNEGRQYQVPWNELTGTGTVMALNDQSAAEPKQAFKYNAWAFCARNDSGCAPDDNNFAQGTPGDLELTGGGAGTYDACPAYNIANFMPNGAKLGNVETLNNNLAVASCNQDLRETYLLHLTKLDFTVWNSHEQSFTGAYACVDSVESLVLGNQKPMVQGTNFDYTTLQTPNARFQVNGISATPPCKFPTEPTGVLSVIHSATAISKDKGSDADVGNTVNGTGFEAGFVYWDVSP